MPAWMKSPAMIIPPVILYIALLGMMTEEQVEKVISGDSDQVVDQ